MVEDSVVHRHGAKAGGDAERSVAAARGRITGSLVTVLAILAALAILLSLGTWQVERLHWKEGLLADMAARRQAEPVPLAAIEAMAGRGLDAGRTQDIEYRRVTVSGRFDHARERHFFATLDGRTGFYIYTPLMLADGRAVFVNRGFVPYELKEAASRAAGNVEGEQTVTGYARGQLAGKPSWLVPDNDPARNIFFWKDLAAMVQTSGLDPARVAPFFVDADASVQAPGGWPKGGVTQFDLPNNHLQYALTWYGLAAALVAVVFAAWWRRRRPASLPG